MSCGACRGRRTWRSGQRFIGRELEAVVIERKGRGAEVLTGNNISVAVPDRGVPRRALVTVRLTEATADSTRGQVSSFKFIIQRKLET